MKKNVLLLVLVLFLLSGCTTTQKSATAGGLGGGAIGGIIGHQSGHGVEGAAIGAAVGTVGGLIVGNKIEKKKFCPVGGEVYGEDVQYCPNHGVELKEQTKE